MPKWLARYERRFYGDALDTFGTLKRELQPAGRSLLEFNLQVALGQGPPGLPMAKSGNLFLAIQQSEPQPFFPTT
jgi:hypothetical protein